MIKSVAEREKIEMNEFETTDFDWKEIKYQLFLMNLKWFLLASVHFEDYYFFIDFLNILTVSWGLKLGSKLYEGLGVLTTLYKSDRY